MEWRWDIEDTVVVLRLLPLPPGLADLHVRARAVGPPPPPPADAVGMKQVHGAGVTWVDEPGPPPACDALRTAATGVLLTVRTADCLPLVLVSPREGIAVVHAGWRGLAGGVVEAALATFRKPDPLWAVLGPAIGPCCFEVGPEVAGRFPESVVRPARARRPHVDLPGDAVRRLRAAGLAPGRIVRGPGCTRCHQHLLCSHRGSGGDGSRLVTGARFAPA
jgi:YfiH family protein